MAAVYFFATAEDLCPLLRDFESSVSVRYFRRGRFADEAGEEYGSLLNVPGLGVADSDSSATCSGFLALDATSRAVSRKIDTYEGIRYFYDQLANPDSIVIVPGGVWKQKILLRGTAGTAHLTSGSKRLMRAFRKALMAHTQRVKHCFIGPQAEAALDSGEFRLTVSEGSPLEYDLAR